MPDGVCVVDERQQSLSRLRHTHTPLPPIQDERSCALAYLSTFLLFESQYINYTSFCRLQSHHTRRIHFYFFPNIEPVFVDDQFVVSFIYIYIFLTFLNLLRDVYTHTFERVMCQK